MYSQEREAELLGSREYLSIVGCTQFTPWQRQRRPGSGILANTLSSVFISLMRKGVAHRFGLNFPECQRSRGCSPVFVCLSGKFVFFVGFPSGCCLYLRRLLLSNLNIALSPVRNSFNSKGGQDRLTWGCLLQVNPLAGRHLLLPETAEASCGLGTRVGTGAGTGSGAPSQPLAPCGPGVPVPRLQPPSLCCAGAQEG